MKRLFQTLGLWALGASLAVAQSKPAVPANDYRTTEHRADDERRLQEKAARQAAAPVTIQQVDKWGRPAREAEKGAATTLVSGQTGYIGNTNSNLYCGTHAIANNGQFTNDVDTYAGTAWMESGPDVTYLVTVNQAALVRIELNNMTADLDLFLMSSQNSADCFAYGNQYIQTTLKPGTYWLNVDGFQGAVSNYDLTMTCFCIPDRTLNNATDQMDLLTVNGVSSSAPQPTTRNPAYNGPNAFTTGVIAGQKFPISAMHTGYAHYHRMFVDYNDNGYYEASELVKEWNTQTVQLNDSVAIDPAKHGQFHGANGFTYRTRVQSSAGAFNGSDACATVTFGSCIDGTISVSAPSNWVTTTAPACLGGITTFKIYPGVSAVPPNTTWTVQITRGAGHADSTLFITNGLTQGYQFPVNFKRIDGDQIKVYNSTYAANMAPQPMGYSDGPAAPTTTGGTHCQAGNVVLTATPPAGMFVDWYSAQFGGTKVGTGTPFTTPVINGNTYFWAVSRQADGCVSRFRNPALAEINPGPFISSVSTYEGVTGTEVVITGSWLTTTGVNFNGKPAEAFGDQHTLLTNVPAGATTGRIKITNPGCPEAQSDYDFVVKYPSTSSADWRWIRRTSGPGAERINRVRMSKDGYVFSAGAYSGNYTSWEDGLYSHMGGKTVLMSKGGLDGIVNCYTKKGEFKWYTTFSSTGDDEVLGLATDKYGYVYVSGYFSNTMDVLSGANGTTTTLTSAGKKDAFVAKIHPNGTLMYLFRFGNTGDDQAAGIDVTLDGRLYVAGSFIGTTTIQGSSGTAITLTSRGNSDAFLAKFTDIGTMYWLIQAGGTGNDFAYGAAADAQGGGYLMGSFEASATFNSSLPGTQPITKMAVGGSDGFVLRVNKTGALKWVSSMGGIYNENVRDLAPDPRGTGVVGVGGFTGTAQFGATQLASIGYYDAFATRLDTNGNFQWTTRAGGFGQDQAWAVRLDKQGNPFVALSISQQARNFGGAANTLTSLGGTDALIVKLNAANGNALWQAQGGGAADDQARAIDTSANGSALAGGMYGTGARFGVNGPYAEANASSGDGWFGIYGNYSTATGREGLEEEAITPTITSTTLTVYPNPSRGGAFSLKGEGVEAGSLLEVLSADGRVIHSQTVTEQHLQGDRIALGMPAGIYLIRCGARQARLVVQ